jgi:hypothetical protein
MALSLRVRLREADWLRADLAGIAEGWYDGADAISIPCAQVELIGLVDCRRGRVRPGGQALNFVPERLPEPLNRAVGVRVPTDDLVVALHREEHPRSGGVAPRYADEVRRREHERAVGRSAARSEASRALHIGRRGRRNRSGPGADLGAAYLPNLVACFLINTEFAGGVLACLNRLFS